MTLLLSSADYPPLPAQQNWAEFADLYNLPSDLQVYPFPSPSSLSQHGGLPGLPGLLTDSNRKSPCGLPKGPEQVGSAT